MRVSDSLCLPDDAGDTRLSGQQREHDIVAMVLIQAVLAHGLVVDDGSLAIQEGKGQVAVGVLGRQRSSGREGQLVVIAAVV